MKRTSLILTALLTAAAAFAADGAFGHLLAADTIAKRPLQLVLSDPAMADMRSDSSLTQIQLDYALTDRSAAEAVADGKRENGGRFYASSYIRTRTATIGGFASYFRSKRYGTKAYETSNAALLYPYLSADSIAGDMDSEQYAFGGFYNSTAGALRYGAELDYTALQEYRTRDPRPKNTVGLLRFALGLATDLGRQRISVGGRVHKYKQTNSISFVSELGEAKIHHTTGLGTHYARFAGNGKEAYYNGYLCGASASTLPMGSGMYGAADYERFSFKKIITDFNRLPLAHSRIDNVRASAGWKNANITAGASFAHSVQKGAQNIFGDPQGNVYPQIARIADYRAEDDAATVEAAWHKSSSDSRIDIFCAANWHRQTQRAGDEEPRRHRRIESYGFDIRSAWLKTVSRKILLHTSAHCSASFPTGCRMTGVDAGPDFLIAAERYDFSAASSRTLRAGASVRTDYALTATYALGIKIAYNYVNYHKFLHGNGIDIALLFSF